MQRSYEDQISNNKIGNLTIEQSESADPDATWLKKGNKYHFGFNLNSHIFTHDSP